MQDLVLAFENLGSLSSKENEFKIRISFRGPSADFEKVKGVLPKSVTNPGLILFRGQGPKICKG